MANMFKKVLEMADLALDNYLGELKKAVKNRQPDTELPMDMHMRRSFDIDPDLEHSQYGYKQKLTLVPDETKRLMSLKDPVIAAIQQVRVQQLATFAKPQSDKYSPGFIFQRRGHLEETELNSKDMKDEQAKKKKLTDFICNCGIIDEARTEANELMNFGTFLKLIGKDRLIYDAVAIERIPDKRGRLHHFLPVSGATIRYAAKNLSANAIYQQEYNNKFTKERFEHGEYKYVQVIKGRIRQGFTDDDIVYKFANPTNDMFTNGYSISELDLLINTISAHLFAEKYNRSIFTHGFNTRGMLNLKGDVSDEQMQALRRAWYSQGVGYDGMFRTPIINSPEGVEWIPLMTSQKDMEFANYMDYLIKIACAIYLIAPEEINFSSNRGVTPDSGSMNYNNVERNLKLSADKGLRPLLRFVEEILNEEILPRFDAELAQEYEFKFIGLDIESRLDERDRLEKEIHLYKTVNEIRREKGLPPIEDCDIILDNVYMAWYDKYSEAGQAKQAQDMAQQQAAQGQAPGGESEDDSDFQELQSEVASMQGEEQEEEAPIEKSLRPQLLKIEYYKKN